MAPQRIPLAPISANQGPWRELNAFQRGQISGAAAAEKTTTEIGSLLNLPQFTVKIILFWAFIRFNRVSKPRSGRPSIFSDWDRWKIIWEVCLNSKAIYAQLKLTTELDFSIPTFQKVLQDCGICNWISKKRPCLHPQDAAIQLKWVLKHQDWTAEKWQKVIWLDECSVEWKQNKQMTWTFRISKEKWPKAMIADYLKGKGITVMIVITTSGDTPRTDTYT